MKKILLVAFALMVSATWSFAAFNPTPLEISVSDEIIYPFDGTSVDFTVDISGKPAKCFLIINTRLPEAQLPQQLQNGYLGWHYVNRIDTTVYVSGAFNFMPGSNTITWDGKGTENTSGGYGGTYEKFDNVAPGTYDYYVWGYDDQTPRQAACNFIAVSFYWQPQYTKFGEWDEAGLPRTNPLIWGNVPYMYNNLHRARDEEGNYLDEPEEGANSYGPERWTAFKFPLGSDPDDMNQLQTTFMPGFSQEAQLDACAIVFDPQDQDYFYNLHVYTEQKTGALFKWHWIGDGNAEMIDGWGGWDELLYETASRRGMGEYMEELQTDGDYIYIASPGRDPYEIQHDWLWCVDFDGNKVFEQQMDDFYTPDNPLEGTTHGTINLMYTSKEYQSNVVVGGVFSCTFEMADADRIRADEGDDEYIMWRNENGDFFNDNSWDPTSSTHLWNCNTGEYRTPNGGRTESYFYDSQELVHIFKSYQGLYSFIVCTQDGSGITYGKFADDTVASDKNKKGAGHKVDNGSQFDGLYIGDVVSDDAGYGNVTQHVQWVGFDSAHGVISSTGGEAVEEEGQAAFSVDAAYPNPANPTTTIGFTLAEAGHVTVDIYNVAGQKVDTLVDDEMSAGKHSVVWNGSGFSAGVYFYTVKSDNFSKSMKVTLLK